MWLTDLFRNRRIMHRHHRETMAAIKTLHEDVLFLKLMVQMLLVRHPAPPEK